jgi:hypothetical protein
LNHSGASGRDVASLYDKGSGNGSGAGVVGAIECRMVGGGPGRTTISSNISGVGSRTRGVVARRFGGIVA